MEGLGENDASLRVLMLPWLAHGHIFPFLELAKRLCHEKMLVYICSTPINLNSIREELNDKAFPFVKLVELRLPELPQLPPHLHTTKHLPSHLMPLLKTAFDRADPSFREILATLRPDILVYDFLQPWAPQAARDRGIPAVLFLASAASSTAFFSHCLKKPGEEFPFAVPGSSHVDTVSLGRVANGISNGDRLLRCMDLSSDFVAIRTFREIESEYIEYLSSLIGKAVIPVGPLITDTLDEDHDSSRKLTEWLDKKERSSVVFASFGSEYFMPEEEMEEIAKGLVLSKVSFIWVVRFPKGGEEEEEKETVKQGAKQVQCGFMERIDDDVGLVLAGWAPQREILNHRSIGGFLTHCGWSSVLEGMRYGVPMIALPMQLDQPINAKLVAELGIGVEVKRDGNSRMYRREDVAKGIRHVVVNEEGFVVRRKARELAEMMGRKGNEEIGNLVANMSVLCTGGKERKDVLKNLSSD